MKLREYKSKYDHYFLDEEKRLQGERKLWHSNGQQWYMKTYRNGALHGEFKTWHENGQQWEISHRRDDKYHGERKVWYANGRLSETCHFRDGKLHGELRWWDWSGRLVTHNFYINSEKIIDFKKTPELYPSTPEEKTIFVLKYGNAPFIGDEQN